MRKSIIFTVLVSVVMLLVLSCSDAEIASMNVSKAADQFEIYRRVVFYNGITHQYILMVEGYCSIEKSEDGILRVTVKTEKGEYLKHYLGLSDNVTFFAEQLMASKVSDRRYRVIFKPSAILPDVEVR